MTDEFRGEAEPRVGTANESQPEPTMEQLENTMVAMGLPVLPEGLRPPFYRESLLNLHALVVRTVNGDEKAARSLDAFVAAFGTPRAQAGASSRENTATAADTDTEREPS
jgi:hypothetical protein